MHLAYRSLRSICFITGASFSSSFVDECELFRINSSCSTIGALQITDEKQLLHELKTRMPFSTLEHFAIKDLISLLESGKPVFDDPLVKVGDFFAEEQRLLQAQFAAQVKVENQRIVAEKIAKEQSRKAEARKKLELELGITLQSGA